MRGCESADRGRRSVESALKRSGVGAVTSRKRWRGRGNWHASQRGEGARHSHIMTCPTVPRWNLPLLRRPRTYQSLRRPSPRPQTLPKTRTLHIFSAASRGEDPRRQGVAPTRQSAHISMPSSRRIEAHNERMALQRRMSGVGGRPTNAATSSLQQMARGLGKPEPQRTSLCRPRRGPTRTQART